MWNLKTHLILGLQGGVDGCTNLWSVNNFPPKRHIGIQTFDLNSNTTVGPQILSILLKQLLSENRHILTL